MVNSSTLIATGIRRYAVYVNENRAIPAFTDGLKQGQRIALWLMRKREGHIKTMALAGSMIESLLYVHGDQSAASSISNLAAPYLNNIPLLRGKGNFGTLLVPDGWASARYTEVTKPNYINDLLYQDSDILPMVDNYDGSVKMPAYFLPMVPMVLLNGQKGAGWGHGSHIFPRSFQNVVKATLLAIEGKAIPDDLLQPVFAYNNNNTGTFVEYTADGKPRWEFRGAYTQVNSTTIEITELPSVPNYLVENYKEFLNNLEEKGIINDYEDHSTKAVRIVVKFPRQFIAKKTTEEMMNLLGLIKTAGENIVVVGSDGWSLPNYRHEVAHKYAHPVARLIHDWVEWRFRYMHDRYTLLIKQTEDRLNYLKVLKECFDKKLPDVFLTVKNKAELKTVINTLATAASLFCDDVIEDRITGRASYSWTTESYASVLNEIAEETDLLVHYQDLLASEPKRRNVFKAEVGELKKIKDIKL